MEQVHVESFKVIGVPVRTSDKFGKSVVDVGLTGLRFGFYGLYDKIPNKANENSYVVYTDAEPKYLGDFTAIIGCAVSSFDEVPEGMVGTVVPGGEYTKYSVHGEATEVVVDKWNEIWKKDEETSRIRTTDFDVYNGYPINLSDVNVDIYVNEGK